MTTNVVQATGRRKTAVARVRLVPGTGQVRVNGRDLTNLPITLAQRAYATEPLRLAELAGSYDVIARVDGGGVSGQIGALRHGIARAIVELEPELRVKLKREGMLTRDAREKESKKYGLKKARKAPQYSKR
jgi:small subunit ribosomal protein S9